MAHAGTPLPKARDASELVIEELPDELLVYDVRNHRAHCLNRSAAEVFRACDGMNGVDVAASRLAAAGLPAGPEIVELAVAELRAAGLLVERPAPARDVAALSRRDMLRRVGFIAGAAVAIPLVQSIVAPSVAEAASCGGTGQSCCGGGTCNSPNDICAGGTCVPNN